MFALHQTAGLCLLALMVLRPFARLCSAVPPAVSGPGALGRAAQMTHTALYLLMMGMPVLGVLAVAWAGKTIGPVGLDWRIPLRPDMLLAHLAKHWHKTGATLVYVFVGLHAAAALWHEFVLKDRLLSRMR
ncbi:cytochrome b [Pandoraea vervacti]|uniref:cytochrome b n=1 Tax=Pandoraea vervacti TaxID=656178 RepID=UPI003002099A